MAMEDWFRRKGYLKAGERFEVTELARSVNRNSWLLVVVEQAEDVVLGEAFAAAEEVEFDGEGEAGDFAAELFDELDGGFHGAAGGEQVVDEQDALAGLDGVEVDFERVGAVFEIVGDAGYRCGQLARLADGDEAGIEAVGERGAEDESAGFDAEDEVDLAFKIVGGERVDEHGEAGAVFEQRGDVVEEDARLGEVGHGAHERLERRDIHGFRHESCCSWSVGWPDAEFAVRTWRDEVSACLLDFSI